MPKVPKKLIKKAFAKKHSDTSLTDSAIVAIYLDYLLFVKRLTKEAEQIATTNRECAVDADHFRKASETVLNEFQA